MQGTRNSFIQMWGGAPDLSQLTGQQRQTRSALSGLAGQRGLMGSIGQGLSNGYTQTLPMQGGLSSYLQQIAQGRQSGVPTSDLQRQGTNSLLQYLSMPAPEQRAMDIAMPALQQMLTGTPGSDVLDPLRAVANRNLNDSLGQMTATAPGRWNTAALYNQGQARTRAEQDFNLLASQIMEQGRQRQLQAANTLGVLANTAGNAPFQRLGQATELGQAQTGMSLQNQQFGQQQQLQGLMAILQLLGGPTFGGPFTQGASGWENFLGGLQTVSGFMKPGGGQPQAQGSGNLGTPTSPNISWLPGYGPQAIDWTQVYRGL